MRSDKKIKKEATPTKDKILRAAREIFIKQGFAGASIGNIAALAAVNHSLVFHHFQDKQNLWECVKSDIMQEAQVQPLANNPATLKEFLLAAITQRITLYEKSPLLLRLVGWQRLEDATKKKTFSAGKHPVTPLHWLERINYLQNKKLISRHLQPDLIMIWLVNSINGIILDELHLFATNPEDKKKYIDLILNGMEKALRPS